MELGPGSVAEGRAAPRAKDMLDLSRPDMDFTAIAKGPRCGTPPGRRLPMNSSTISAAPSPPRGPTVIEAMVLSIF